MMRRRWWLLALCLLLLVAALSSCAKNEGDSQFSRYALDRQGTEEMLGSADVIGQDVQLYRTGGSYAFIRQGYLLMAVNAEKGGADYGLDMSALGIPWDQLQILISDDGGAVALTMPGAAVYVWIPEKKTVYTVGQNDLKQAVWAFSPSGRYFVVDGVQKVRFDTRKHRKWILTEAPGASREVFVNDKGSVLLCGSGACILADEKDGNAEFSLGDLVLGLNASGQALAFRDGVVTAHTQGQVRTLATVGTDYSLIAKTDVWAAFSNNRLIRIVTLKSGKEQVFPVPPLGVQLLISAAGTRVLAAASVPSASVWAGKDKNYQALTWTLGDRANMTLYGEDGLIWLEQDADGTWQLYKGTASKGAQTTLCTISGS